MKKIRLIDACFPGNPSSIAGDNVWRGPEHFEWSLAGADSVYTWFTNWTLMNVAHGKYPKRVVWLLEPPSIQDWPYDAVITYRKEWDAIMTYDKRLLQLGDNRFKFAPHGGSWIDWDLWGMHEKTKDVCMIVSDKNESEGHKLRHEIAKEFGDRIDVYGPSYQRFDRKFDVLKDYRYCVVVESVKMDYYFSEKLIDPISVGCIPIYWGCPSITRNDFIGSVAMIEFYEMEKLKSVLEWVSRGGWFPEYGIKENLEKAKQYRMPEDWMFEHYPELFR